MAGFGIASLLCALAIDPAMLIASRILQGAFGALLIPQGMGILISTFSRAQFPTAASMFGPVLGAATLAGPILAGFLIGADLWGLTWRPIFLINILLCGAGLVASWFILPKNTHRRPVSIDGLGSGLLAAGMFGLIYGLIDGSTSGWTATSWQVLGAAVIFLILFGWRQATAKNPLILRSLLHNHGFTSGMLVGLGYFAAVNGFAYVISLYFQLGLGFKPAGAALAMSPMMIGIVISSFIARPLIPKLGRRLVAVALAVTLLAVVGMLATGFAMGTAVTAWALAPSVLVLGSAWAQASPPSTTSPSATCDRRKQAAQAAPCPPCNRSPTPSDPLSSQPSTSARSLPTGSCKDSSQRSAPSALSF